MKAAMDDFDEEDAECMTGEGAAPWGRVLANSSVVITAMGMRVRRPQPCIGCRVEVGGARYGGIRVGEYFICERCIGELTR